MSVTDTGRRTAVPALGTFERYLTVWVALCILKWARQAKGN
jgi:hypothetical protein